MKDHLTYSPSTSDCPGAMSGDSKSELLSLLVIFNSFFIEILDDILSWYSLNRASTYSIYQKFVSILHSTCTKTLDCKCSY